MKSAQFFFENYTTESALLACCQLDGNGSEDPEDAQISLQFVHNLIFCKMDDLIRGHSLDRDLILGVAHLCRNYPLITPQTDLRVGVIVYGGKIIKEQGDNGGTGANF